MKCETPVGPLLLSARLMLSALLPGCIDDRVALVADEVGPSHLKTASLVLVSGRATPELDLLLVVDNSVGMGPKHQRLADAATTLLQRLLAPWCERSDDPTAGFAIGKYEACPEPYWRVSNPFNSVHVGVITTSLGGYGDPGHCETDATAPHSEEGADRAHLLASLPRGRDAAPSANEFGFFALDEGSDLSRAGAELSALILSAGEHGCGFEAPLEAWLRFLVDPAPHANVVVEKCPDRPDASCAGPELDASGVAKVDSAVLAQRAAFVRPDAQLLIAMLSDENDCSFRPFGQAWHLSHVSADNRRWAPRGSSACAETPVGQCCEPCTVSEPRSGCSAEINAEGESVPAGCAERTYHAERDDPTNLRCFDQKRRFGMDALFPIERYVNAVREAKICPASDTLSPAACDAPVDNPMLVGTEGGLARPYQISVLGIVGVPELDLAVRPPFPHSLELEERVDALALDEGTRWSWLLADPETGNAPLDPLMTEQVQPRTGMHPWTGEALAAPDAAYGSNSINGHERTTPLQDSLQYACVSSLAEPIECVSSETSSSYCACELATQSGFSDPQCQAPDSTQGQAQRATGAEPATRILSFLSKVPYTALGASVCSEGSEAEPGYLPLARQLRQHYEDFELDVTETLCTDRKLLRRDDGGVNCRLLEVMLDGYGNKLEVDCNRAGRVEPSAETLRVTRQLLAEDNRCPADGCSQVRACEVRQILPGARAAFRACTTELYPKLEGWCALRRPEAEDFLARCPESVREGLRMPSPLSDMRVLLCTSVE